MKKFFNNSINKHPIFSTISAIVLICTLFWIIQLATHTKVTVKFKDLRPFHSSAPVYFKGFKVGRVIKIAPSRDYQNTIVTILIHPKIKLPANTTAKLKVHKTRWMHRDYLDLIYPESPDLAYLKNGSVISGETSIDLNSYIANISPDTYKQMEDNISSTLQNLNDTTGMLFSVFSIINNILSESEADLKNTVSNFAKTSQSSSQIVGKIDNAISQQQLERTLSNIQSTTFNANSAVLSFKDTATEINKTVPNINTTIDGVNSIVTNVNEITCGVKHTMCKRFGGLRLFFGQPVLKNCTCK